MRDHCYWPFVSDLINVLSHKPVAYKFMVDERLLQLWFEITSCLQGMSSSTGWVSTYAEIHHKNKFEFEDYKVPCFCISGMNLNKRELVQHVQYEPETYYAAFSAELEISLSPMWSLLAHCDTEVGDLQRFCLINKRSPRTRPHQPVVSKPVKCSLGISRLHEGGD